MSKRNWLQIAVGLLFGGLMIGVAVFQFQEANAKSLESTAVLAADSYLRALEAVREVYTSEVVNRLEGSSVVVTHDYERYEHAVPLPATFTLSIADNLSPSIEGLSVRLYSEYPFPFRGEVEMDDFERAAFDVLAAKPDSFFSQVQGAGADRVLRYARGDTMRAECVSCHNSHPESPKTDWEVGDLRGVLAISFPLRSYDQAAREARRPYTMLLLLALLGLLGAFVMLVQHLPRLPRLPRLVLPERPTTRENRK